MNWIRRTLPWAGHLSELSTSRPRRRHREGGGPSGRKHESSAPVASTRGGEGAIIAIPTPWTWRLIGADAAEPSGEDWQCMTGRIPVVPEENEQPVARSKDSPPWSRTKAQWDAIHPRSAIHRVPPYSVGEGPSQSQPCSPAPAACPLSQRARSACQVACVVRGCRRCVLDVAIIPLLFNPYSTSLHSNA